MNTFAMYLLEQLHIHIFGGNGNYKSHLSCLLRVQDIVFWLELLECSLNMLRYSLHQSEGCGVCHMSVLRNCWLTVCALLFWNAGWPSLAIVTAYSTLPIYLALLWHKYGTTEEWWFMCVGVGGCHQTQHRPSCHLLALLLPAGITVLPSQSLDHWSFCDMVCNSHYDALKWTKGVVTLLLLAPLC